MPVLTPRARTLPCTTSVSGSSSPLNCGQTKCDCQLVILPMSSTWAAESGSRFQGTVPIDRILTGQETVPGDIVVGLRSSGIHSNGLTLARRILFDKLGWPVDKNVPELGRSIGEELLEPTRIYVMAVRSMIGAGLRVKALAHITSTGFLNLSRASAPAGYVLDSLPEPPPVFKLIQHCGNVCDAEMFFTYNMGIGFCVVVAPEDADKVLGIAKEHNVGAQVIGHTTKDADKKVSLPSYGLVGRSDKFFPQVR